MAGALTLTIFSELASATRGITTAAIAISKFLQFEMHTVASQWSAWDPPLEVVAFLTSNQGCRPYGGLRAPR
jgi:hypothetical protein